MSALEQPVLNPVEYFYCPNGHLCFKDDLKQVPGDVRGTVTVCHCGEPVKPIRECFDGIYEELVAVKRQLTSSKSQDDARLLYYRLAQALESLSAWKDAVDQDGLPEE
jgi:hypothetical protein